MTDVGSRADRHRDLLALRAHHHLRHVPGRPHSEDRRVQVFVVAHPAQASPAVGHATHADDRVSSTGRISFYPHESLKRLNRIVAALLFTALGLGASSLACRGGSESSTGAQVELTVYAATSLRDAPQEIGKAFETQAGDKLVFNFGSSGDLARQIVAANRADLFFSADEKELDRVEQAGLVEAGTRRSLLANQLVVIESLDTTPSLFGAPFDPGQLADARLELLSLGNTDTVPAGKYAKAWLQSRGVWDKVAAKVLPGVDVRAALAAVESGGARAGIVYRTDAAHSSKVRVLYAVPMAEGPQISYPLAVLTKRANGAHAKQLAAHLASDEASAVFERLGFPSLGRTQ